MSLEQVKNEAACEPLSLSLYRPLDCSEESHCSEICLARDPVCFQTTFSCWIFLLFMALVNAGTFEGENKSIQNQILKYSFLGGDKHKSRSLTAQKDGQHKRSGCSENFNMSLCCTDSIQCPPAQHGSSHIRDRCNIHLYLFQCYRPKKTPPPSFSILS